MKNFSMEYLAHKILLVIVFTLSINKQSLQEKSLACKTQLQIPCHKTVMAWLLEKICDRVRYVKMRREYSRPEECFI